MKCHALLHAAMYPYTNIFVFLKKKKILIPKLIEIDKRDSKCRFPPYFACTVLKIE